MTRAAVGLAALVLSAACSSSSTTAAVTTSTTAVAEATATAARRPNVPGAPDARVTQAAIAATICTPGWSTKVRPPQTETEAIKKRLYRDEHLTGGLGAFELDHLIPLEVGGAPSDPANLWLEPITDARRADKIENQAHADVCAGRSTLTDGQRAVVAWKQAHG